MHSEWTTFCTCAFDAATAVCLGTLVQVGMKRCMHQSNIPVQCKVNVIPSDIYSGLYRFFVCLFVEWYWSADDCLSVLFKLFYQQLVINKLTTLALGSTCLYLSCRALRIFAGSTERANSCSWPWQLHCYNNIYAPSWPDRLHQRCCFWLSK